jgi:hypothetical protein
MSYLANVDHEECPSTQSAGRWTVSLLEPSTAESCQGHVLKLRPKVGVITQMSAEQLSLAAASIRSVPFYTAAPFGHCRQCSIKTLCR